MTWSHPLKHILTQPSTQPPIHPAIGGGVSANYKSSNRIEIYRLVQVLLNFECFRGSPLGDGGWLEVGGGWWGVHLTHMHMHTHTYDIIGNSQGFPQWGRPFEWNYHVYHACMCVCVCMHVHVHVCGGHPQPPPTPIRPPPRAAGSRKNQNSITLELIEIIWFCLKILLPLNIPELI